MLGPKGQPPGFSLPSHRPTISLHNTALCLSVPSQHNRLHRDRKNSLRTQLMRVPAATQCPQLTDTQALCSKTPHFILSTPQLCSYGGQAGAEKGPSLTAPLPSSPWPVTSTAVDSLAQEWGTGHSGIWPAPLKFSKQLLQKETWFLTCIPQAHHLASQHRKATGFQPALTPPFETHQGLWHRSGPVELGCL